jgi:PKD repeat protein
MRHPIRWAAAGFVLASLLVLAGCSSLDPAPVGNFSWTPSDPLSRSDVQFSDLSTDSGFLGGGGVTSWSWDFGDSGTSTSSSPQHEYARSGNYTVRLTVKDSSGNETTVSKSITVRASLNGTWSGTLDNNGVPLGLVLNIQHSSSGGIGGTGSWGALTFPIFSASLTGNQVTFVFTGNRALTGTLDYTERSMSGTWSVAGAIGFGWNVMLQGG